MTNDLSVEKGLGRRGEKRNEKIMGKECFSWKKVLKRKQIM